MLVGYMRVSTAEQNLALQRDALQGAGCERVYEDTCGGSVTDRPGLSRALDTLREGDALVVWKLDRIGRSLAHVVELVGALQKRGVGLKVLTGGIDTTSAAGRLVFGIFATLSEFERDLIRERTLAGLAAARARPYWRAATTDDACQAAHGHDDDGRPEQRRVRGRRAARHFAQHTVRLRRWRGPAEATRQQAAHALIGPPHAGILSDRRAGAAIRSLCRSAEHGSAEANVHGRPRRIAGPPTGVTP